ncbi:MAG: ABC transporter ATP-binding protein [Gemmatimonadaceae bacterium]
MASHAPRLPKPRDAAEGPPSWGQRVEALRYLPKLLGLVWATHRGYATAMLSLRLGRAFFPIATLWVGKLITDTVFPAGGAQVELGRLWRLVALEVGIVVAGDLLGRASALIESLLGDLFSNRISVRLMEHAATLDLAQFEDPAFYDHLERARRQTVGRIGLLATLLGIAQDAITLASLGAALVAYNPWLVALLPLAILPSFFGDTFFASLEYSLLFRWTPERRELDYIRYVGASDRTAKEVQLFGLAPWLIDRYRALSDRFYDENRRLSLRKGIVGSLLSIVGTLGYYGAYAMILLRAVHRTISIGTLAFLIGAFARSRDLVQRILASASDIVEQSLYLRDLFVFFDTRPRVASRPGATAVPRPLRDGFTFEDVGFQYPGSDRWAVRHLSFRITAGERVALVGENGAGKTTITKLLARLYDPTEGRILLDGVDLRDYELASVRRAIGVIFQDFVRYDMRFDENVGVGEIDGVRAYLDQAAAKSEPASNGSPEDSGVPRQITAAAQASLADSLLPCLDGRYRQMLGRRFDDGVDLSGGEWQKVALARAYMRDAQVLILDEPTAALDARAEYDVFVRFSALMAGRTGVIISHRFSTVRMADRIVVLRDGRVAEEGAHDVLAGGRGLYAELFQMQAAGYR